MEIITKKCTKCGEEKSLSLFYASKASKDKLASHCKLCDKKRLSLYYKNNHEVIGRRSKARYKKNILGVKKTSAARYVRKSQEIITKVTEYNAAFPLKTKARRDVQYSIKKGDIIRPEFCDDCKEVCKPDAHHDDYSKPLEVRFLCRSCHKQWHSINGEGLNGT